VALGDHALAGHGRDQIAVERLHQLAQRAAGTARAAAGNDQRPLRFGEQRLRGRERRGLGG